MKDLKSILENIALDENNNDKYKWSDINKAMSGSGLNPRVIMNVLSKLKGKSQN